MIRGVIIAFIILLIHSSLLAQDSLTMSEIRIQQDTAGFTPNPKKSALFSAMLPGAGQFYNRQYWKVPAIYVGVGACAYFINFNLKEYRRYKSAYIGRLTTNNPTDEFINTRSTSDLKTLQDIHKKYLDITVLLMAVGYTIQIADALAAAHLNNFDISRDITLRLEPVVVPQYTGVGFAIRYNIR